MKGVRFNIKVAAEGCLAESSVPALKNLKTKTYLVHCWGGTTPRALAKLTLPSGKPVLVDVVTGTLFDIQTGRAATSPFVYVVGPA